MNMAGAYLIFVLLTASPSPEDANRHDMEMLQGDWQVVSMTFDGDRIADDEAQVLFRSVKGEEYSLFQFDKVLAKGALKIDANQRPKCIDDQPTQKDRKPRLGIYEFDGDRLRMCFAAPGSPRPKEFVSKPDSGVSLTVWERVKK
jgi:uncharacterized protein (TIGR03067 family)